MAVIKLEYKLGTNSFYEIGGNLGTVHLTGLNKDISSQIEEDNGTAYRQVSYIDPVLVSIFEYDIMTMTNPSPYKQIISRLSL